MFDDTTLFVLAATVIPAVLIPLWLRAALPWKARTLLVALSTLPLALVPHWFTWGLVALAWLACVFVFLVSMIETLRG